MLSKQNVIDALGVEFVDNLFKTQKIEGLENSITCLLVGEEFNKESIMNLIKEDPNGFVKSLSNTNFNSDLATIEYFKELDFHYLELINYNDTGNVNVQEYILYLVTYKIKPDTLKFKIM